MLGDPMMLFDPARSEEREWLFAIIPIIIIRKPNPGHSAGDRFLLITHLLQRLVTGLRKRELWWNGNMNLIFMMDFTCPHLNTFFRSVS